MSADVVVIFEVDTGVGFIQVGSSSTIIVSIAISLVKPAPLIPLKVIWIVWFA